MKWLEFSNEEGFLNSEFERKVTTNIRSIDKKVFDDARKINIFAYEVYTELEGKVIQNDTISLFKVVTFSKIHKVFQGIIILIERGLEDEAKALLRVLLEKLIVLKAVHNDSENYKRLVQDADYENHKIANKIEKKEQGLENLNITASILNKCKSNKGVHTSTKRWAELANMSTEYNLVYHVLSGNIHNCLSSLADDCIINEEKQVVTDVVIAPKCLDASIIMQSAMSFFEISVEIILEHFNIEKLKLELLFDK